MALSIDRCLVASFLQEFRENLLVPVKSVPVIHEPVLMTVLSTHDDGTARTTDGVGAETFFKEHSFCSELIDFRSGVDGLEPPVVRADGVGCMVVCKEKDDIGSAFCQNQRGE